jgi:hypothetical protein
LQEVLEVLVEEQIMTVAPEMKMMVLEEVQEVEELYF